jgi:hypothetical protein
VTTTAIAAGLIVVGLGTALMLGPFGDWTLTQLCRRSSVRKWIRKMNNRKVKEA